MVAFDPLTPGSPFCPGECTIFTDANADYNDLVQAINQAWPGNETIETWLEAYDNGVANGPTEEQIQNAIHILQQGFWDFDNPNPPAGSGPDFSATSEWFYNFWTSLGFDSSNNHAPYDFSALAGAFTPEQLNGDWTALVNAFDPAQLPPLLGRAGECLRPRSAHGRLGVVWRRSRPHIDGDGMGGNAGRGRFVVAHAPRGGGLVRVEQVVHLDTCREVPD